MKEILIITARLLATIARLLGRGGAKAIVAENLLLRQQLLVVRPENSSELILLQFLVRCAILGSMMHLLGFLLSLVTTALRTRASLQAEIVALRHQLAVYQRSGPRLRITPADRLLWSVISRLWSGWRTALYFHVVVLNERHLRRLLSGYFAYYHEWRLHRSLQMDAPDRRSERPAKPNNVVESPAVHGLHHYYLPRAA